MAGRILKITKGGGGSTSPGGNNTEVQYNNAGAFGGCAQLFWDNITDRLGIGDNAPAKQLSITKCIKMLVSSGSGVGVIYKGADRFMHDYQAAGANGQNIFVGKNAGNFSMAIAGNAMHASGNMGVGYGSLGGLTSGYRNAAIGYYSLAGATTGYYNEGIGFYAQAALTTGYGNAGIGRGTLRFNTTGNYNIAIGHQAGWGVTGNPISCNVLVGPSAGYALTTGGDNNIMIGYQAGDNVTSGEQNIIIGYNLNALVAASDYQLNIGSLIFGDLGGTKKVGVNTSTMNETLNVGGAIRLGTSALTNDGTIRWTGTDFEGYMTGWKSLTTLKGLNEIFTTQGDILYRGAANPERLPTAVAGAVLTANGAGANPSWREPMIATGDMLVQGADSYTARLAAGANDHVLTANGAGVLPTWQAAQGGATKEFFVPVTHSAQMGYEGTYAAAVLVNSSEYAYITFRVPHDFSSITNATIVVIPKFTTSTGDYDTYSNYAQTGEGFQTHSQSNEASLYNVTHSTVFEVDIAGILTSLAANDNVGIRFKLGTSAHDVSVLGVRFKYS